MTTNRPQKYANNPLIAGLPPESISDKALNKLLSFPIEMPTDETRALPARTRLFLCEDLKRIQIPLDRDFDLELEIATSIREGYVDRRPGPRYWRDHDKEVESILAKINCEEQIFTNSRCIAVTGISGGGKTRGVESALSFYPKVITHDTKANPLLPLKQAVYLKIDFPSNRSPKALCKKFFRELGRMVGEPYEEMYGGGNIDEMLADMARLSQEHFLGLLIIDEIQHACGKSGKAPPALLRFIITLSNELRMPIMFIGTSKALTELRGRLATIRRLIGLTYNRFEKDDPQWVYWTSQIWEYQYTRKKAEIDDPIMDAWYEGSQGILAFAVALFVLAQRREITRGASDEGDECLDAESFRSVYRDHFKAVDPVIQALRSGDELAIEAFEDLPSEFKLETYLKEQTEGFLAKELNRVEKAVGRAGKQMRNHIPELFQRYAKSIDKSVAQKAKDADSLADKMSRTKNEGGNALDVLKNEGLLPAK